MRVKLAAETPGPCVLSGRSETDLYIPSICFDVRAPAHEKVLRVMS